MMEQQPIRFKFNAKKSAQAAAFFLNLSGGQRNYMELVKLMYLADRESLLRLDGPITGDRLASLPRGPVLSRILDLIKWGPLSESDAPWFETVSAPVGYDVKLLPEADKSQDELSSAELQILAEVFATYGKKDWKELSRLTHKLPEYADPNGGSIPIVVEQLLRCAGRSQDDIDRIRHEVSVFDIIDKDLAEYEAESDAPLEQMMA